MRFLCYPDQVLSEYVKVWNDFYKCPEYQRFGCIELCLDGISYFIRIDPTGIRLIRTPDLPVRVTLSCSLNDWVRLASRRLKPLWGILSGRLKFHGDTSFFSALPKVDFTVYLDKEDDPLTPFENNPQKYWVIPRRVLVLNASSRGKKGYTWLLLDRFLQGIRKVSKQVEVIHLNEYRIRGCCGCWYCWQKGEGSCIYDTEDDGRKIFQLMEKSELLVLAFPLYSDGIPACLKTLFDRRIAMLKPFMTAGMGKIRHPRRSISNQAMAILSVSGFVEKKHFNPVKSFFKSIAHNWHVPVIGEIYRPAAMALFKNPLFYDYQQELLKEIELAGERLAAKGYIPRKMKKRIEKNYISIKQFCGSANYYWGRRLKNQDTENY